MVFSEVFVLGVRFLSQQLGEMVFSEEFASWKTVFATSCDRGMVFPEAIVPGKRFLSQYVGGKWFFPGGLFLGNGFCCKNRGENGFPECLFSESGFCYTVWRENGFSVTRLFLGNGSCAKFSESGFSRGVCFFKRFRH